MPISRLSAVALALLSCGTVHADSVAPGKPATAITAELNQAWLQRLPFSDTADFDDARRGLLEPFGASSPTPRAARYGTAGPMTSSMATPRRPAPTPACGASPS